MAGESRREEGPAAACLPGLTHLIPRPKPANPIVSTREKGVEQRSNRTNRKRQCKSFSLKN
jgi:hypothetical protein